MLFFYFFFLNVSNASAVSWKCGCSGVTYTLPQILIDHETADYSTAAGTFVAAQQDCKTGGRTVTLATVEDLDLPCLLAFREHLAGDFPSTSDDDMWVANRAGSCSILRVATATIETPARCSYVKLRYLCQQLVDTSKRNISTLCATALLCYCDVHYHCSTYVTINASTSLQIYVA